MNVGHPFNSLNLDDYPRLDQKVETIAGIQSQAIVSGRQHELSLIAQSGSPAILARARYGL
jgi:hypothetical protein